MLDQKKECPRLVSDIVQSSAATARASGMGRLWMDLGAKSRLHLCDPRVPESIDVIFDEWGCFALNEGLSPGEQMASCASARTFARRGGNALSPVVVLLDYRGKIKITMCGAHDPKDDTLYIWPRDIMPRKSAGRAAFSNTLNLAKYLKEGWAPNRHAPVEQLATLLALG